MLRDAFWHLREFVRFFHTHHGNRWLDMQWARHVFAPATLAELCSRLHPLFSLRKFLQSNDTFKSIANLNATTIATGLSITGVASYD